jgi:DNA-binding LacI/PurR family transcriptional regulator
MAERITIKDISKHLKIHHSTVSRTLRNSPQVKDETKKRIVKYDSGKRYSGKQTNSIKSKINLKK